MGEVYLYPTKNEDFEDYFMVRSDPTDVYWNGYLTPPEKESFRQSFYLRTSKSPFEKPEDRRNYLIKKTENDKTVGFLQLIRKESCVEIGYSVSIPFQGRGYASEALKYGMELAKEFGLPLAVRIRDDNIPSQNVAKNNGFKPTDECIEKNYPKAGIIKLRKYIL